MPSRATFEVYEDVAGAWRWRLVHDNGNVVAEGGQGYTTKRRALDGLESVTRNAPGAPLGEDPGRTSRGDSAATFEVYRDAADAWRWRLVHDNGNVVAQGGQGYVSRGGATNGVESVRVNAPTATVEVHVVEELDDP